MKENQFWDNANRVRELHRFYAQNPPVNHPYDLAYVDEDMTWAEIELLAFALGKNKDGLFLVGNTAQGISCGVHSRFQDIRGLIHDMCGRQREYTIQKTFQASSTSFIKSSLTPRTSFLAIRVWCVVPVAKPPMLFRKVAWRFLKGSGRSHFVIQPLTELEFLESKQVQAEKEGNEDDLEIKPSEREIRVVCEKESIATPVVLNIIQAKGLEF